VNEISFLPADKCVCRGQCFLFYSTYR